MPSTYSNLKIQLMATGENATTWGDITNVNLGTALEEAIVGSADVTFASANVTLTLTDTNTSQTARNMRLRCTGTTGGSTRNLVVPSIEKPYIVQNDCADSIVVKTSAGAGITVPTGKTMWLYCDGTNVVNAVSHLSSLTLGIDLAVADGGTGASNQTDARTNLGLGTIATQNSNSVSITGGSITGITDLAIADGGTGASTAADARTNLGATIIGGNIFTLANPSAITFPRFNADNTVSALDAATFRTAIGAGTSSTTGTVTSVAGTGTVNGLTLTGTVTSSGNLTLGGTLSGVSLTTAVTGTLPIANGGTNATTIADARTNLGATTVGGNMFTLTNPNAVTFPRFNADNTVSALDAATFRSAIGAAGSGANSDITSLSALQSLSITQGSTATAAIAVTSTSGTNPYLSLTDPLGSCAIAGGTSGTLLLRAGGTGAVDNKVFILSSGNVGIGAANPSQRLSVAGNISATGTLLLGTALAVGQGGTGITSTPTDGQLLIGNGTGYTAATITAGSGISITNGTGAITIAATGGSGTVTSVGGTGTVNGLTLTGTVTTSGSLTLGGTLSGVSLTTQVSGTLPVANGGTNATTAAQALTNLGAYPAANPNGYTSNAGTVTSVGGTGSANGLSLSGTVTSSGNITLSGSVTSVAANATIDGVTIGYRNIPRSTTSGTATTGDVGKVIAVSAGITIPNSTFAAGDAVSIYNDSASPITITAGVSTLRQAGTANTGNRTLAARGMATVWFNSATEAIISGAGVS